MRSCSGAVFIHTPLLHPFLIYCLRRDSSRAALDRRQWHGCTQRRLAAEWAGLLHYSLSTKSSDHWPPRSKNRFHVRIP
jgi:hypothetical protein